MPESTSSPVDITEVGGVLRKRRALQPKVRAAGAIFHFAVARLVVVILEALSSEGVGGAAEN